MLANVLAPARSCSRSCCWWVQTSSGPVESQSHVGFFHHECCMRGNERPGAGRQLSRTGADLAETLIQFRSQMLLSMLRASLLLQSYMEDHMKKKDRLEKEWEALCAYQAEPNASAVGLKEGNARKNRSNAVVACKSSSLFLLHLEWIYHHSQDQFIHGWN